MRVLSTGTVRSITGTLTKNDDGLVIHFANKGSRDAFARWLSELQGDASRTPAERYELVRRQMDSGVQTQGE
ncbi:MAG: hypothetical protein B7W98_02775 [Parcubacteria group bacterium 20-58-5]|nr:MAG: hypothetical protein B7W98_02775 [Parcubacteria group bacterium 20-58-5]